MGYEATKDNSGNDVVALGYQAGKDNTIDNQFIVKQANINAVPLIQGDFSTGNVGIGTTDPSEKLEVSDGSKGLTIDPTAASPTINTTANTNVTITSSGGSVIIRLG